MNDEELPYYPQITIQHTVQHGLLKFEISIPLSHVYATKGGGIMFTSVDKKLNDYVQTLAQVFEAKSKIKTHFSPSQTTIYSDIPSENIERILWRGQYSK